MQPLPLCLLSKLSNEALHRALRAGFADCLATPENLDKKLKALRFKVGDRVQCHMGNEEWQSGTIVQLLWRSEGECSNGRLGLRLLPRR